jgi:hypothetical protein
MPSSKTKS